MGDKRKAAKRYTAPYPGDADEPRDRSFGPPVVGIVASTGGLDAVVRFLSAMPQGSGMAFVLVGPLDVKGNGRLTERLVQATEMPVIEAADGVALLGSRLYVAPPDRIVEVKANALRVKAAPSRPSVPSPSDAFLRSLAVDQGNRAVGIVLSGTGNHGSTGVKDIKEADGLVIAQTPETSELDEMPRSAIATNVVDLVLPPEGMADALLSYVRQPYLTRTIESETPSDRVLLDRILALLRARNRFDFRRYRATMLTRRVERRMALRRIESYSEYIERLLADPDELTALYNDLLISVTSCFRDPEAFEALRSIVVPDLLYRCARPGAAERPIRIWVPGCATGEEAYSLAILFMEQAEAEGIDLALRIFATDVNKDALAVARRGVYSESIAAELTPERLKRFFVKTGDGRYQAVRELRDNLVFAEQNVLEDAPFSKLDLVSCRNVLIYLEPKVQPHLISLFHFALNDLGYLFLGSSESVGRRRELFRPVSGKWRIFQRVGAVRTASGYAGVMSRALLDDFAPASVLVNAEYEILCHHGATSRYLDVSVGDPSPDLIAAARQGLRAKLRAACREALTRGVRVALRDCRVKRNGVHAPCAVTVRPIADRGDSMTLLLITFEDHGEWVREGETGDETEATQAQRVRQLEYDLTDAREDLQSAIDDLERSQGDLSASDEEVMSINEELQTAEEELETSKEELQSMNEELATLNRQMREKLGELDKSRNDISNLFAGTNIATLFLDVDLRIKNFTPAVGRLLHVTAADVGRPVSTFAARFNDPDLIADCRDVAANFGRIEKEVWRLSEPAGVGGASPGDGPGEDPAANAEWYLRRVYPHRTQDDRIEGVVVTYIDITRRKRMEAELERSRGDLAKHLSTLEGLVNAMGGGMVIADAEGRLIQFNAVAEKILGLGATDGPPAVWSGHYGLYMRDGVTPIPPGASPLERALAGESVGEVEIFVRNAERPGGVWCRATAAPLMDGKLRGGIVVFRDITREKETIESLRRSESRLDAIVETAADAIITIDDHGIVQSFNCAAESMFGYARAEVIGRNVKMLMPGPENSEHDGYIRHYLETGDARVIGVGREVMGRRKDGSLCPVHLAVSRVDHLGLFAGILHDLTETRALRSDIVNIAVKEQERIGEDLHDGLGQGLTGLGLIADGLQERIRGLAIPDQERRPLQEMADSIVEALRESRERLRQIVKGLVPFGTDASQLPAALTDLAERLDKWNDVTCLADVDVGIVLRDSDVAANLYRIAQEAVNNAYRHAKAHEIRIALKRDGEFVILQVTDNGVGIESTRQGKKDSGSGLEIMKHRARLIGGVLTFEPDPAGGTVVRCAFRHRP